MKDRLSEKIDGDRESILEFVKSLVEYDTQNPPAHNTKEVQDFMVERLQEIGLRTVMIDLYPDEPLVVAQAHQNSRRPTLVFNGHIDVAEVREDEKWDFEPFGAHWDSRYLYGRGAADMKGGLTAAYWAIKTVIQSGLDLKNNVMFQSVSGEEAGEHGTKKLIELGYTGDLAVVAEPNELKMSGQCGVFTMWVHLRSQETYHDGLRSRMIHAGGGIHAASAIEKMQKIIYGLQELERYWAVTKRYPGLRPGGNTINPAVIRGGRNPAFVADQCSVWYTVHFLPDESIQAVENEIRTYLEYICKADPWLRDNPPQIVIGGTSMFRDEGEVFPPAVVQQENPQVQLLAANLRRFTSKEPEFVTNPSVSDAGWFHEFKVPVVTCGPGSLEEAHAVNEKIEIEQIILAAKVYMGLIVDFCTEEGE
jgi:acetylornithine deacetylase